MMSSSSGLLADNYLWELRIAQAMLLRVLGHQERAVAMVLGKYDVIHSAV